MKKQPGDGTVFCTAEIVTRRPVRTEQKHDDGRTTHQYSEGPAHRYTVTLEVNQSALIRLLGARACRNKTGRASYLGGAVVVKRRLDLGAL